MMRELILDNKFKRAVKKLHANQKADLDKAVEAIRQDPTIGRAKIGDLSGRLVHKFHMVNQLNLLAYSYDEQNIYLLMFGDHENFYRDLKRG